MTHDIRMKTKSEITKVRCAGCDKKVDEDRLNDYDLCPACEKEEKKLLDHNRRGIDELQN